MRPFIIQRTRARPHPARLVRKGDLGQLRRVLWVALPLLLSCEEQTQEPPPTSECESTVGSVLGPVTVVLADESVPVPDVDVVFHDGDGGIQSTTKTDPAGRAEGMIAGRGMITIVLGSESRQGLLTFVDVEPNEEIVVALPPDRTDTTLPVNVRFEPFSGAGTTLSIGCSSLMNASPGMITFNNFADGFRPTCFGPDGRFGLLAVAAGASAFAGVEGLSIPSDGLLDAELPPWRTDFGSVDVTLAHLAEPGEVPSHFSLSPAQNGIVFPVLKESRSLLTPDEAFTLERLPTDFGEGLAYSLEVTAPAGQEEGFRSLFFARADRPSRIAIDGDVDLLPRITDRTLEGDPERPSIAWRVSRDAPDGAVLYVQLEARNTDGTLWRHWYVIGPGCTESPFVFPKLPENLRPKQPVDHTVEAVTLMDVSPRKGARAARADLVGYFIASFVDIDIGLEAHPDDFRVRISVDGDFDYPEIRFPER